MAIRPELDMLLAGGLVQGAHALHLCDHVCFGLHGCRPPGFEQRPTGPLRRPQGGQQLHVIQAVKAAAADGDTYVAGLEHLVEGPQQVQEKGVALEGHALCVEL